MPRALIPALASAMLAVGFAHADAAPAGWKTYRDTTLGFSIDYPSGWRVDRAHVYPGFGPDHEIHGVAFEIPRAMAKGTNLSTSLTNVSVESVPGRGTCDATRFLPDLQDLRTLKNAGRVWSTANFQDAGAGNLYDIAVFAIPGTSPCMAVRYMIHSTNIGNYDPGTVKAFDQVSLIRTFAKIRQSLRLKSDR